MNQDELKSLQQKVSLLRSEGKYKETIEASYHLLKCGIEVNDYKSMLIAHMGNAVSYYCIGDIKEAFHSIEAFDQLCDIYGDDEDYLGLYNVLFLLYEYTKDYGKAKKTLEKSIELGKKLEKYNIVSNGYSNFSHLCIEEENYEGALEACMMGLKMAKLHEPASLILEYRVKLNMAKSYIGLEDYETSKSLIDEIIKDPILESFIREKSQCYDLLGNWYLKQKQYRKAFDSYTIAKNLVESYNDLYLLKVIQEERCFLCELMNDFQLGFYVQKEYISLLKEISERELALAAIKLDVKHNLTAVQKRANTDYLTGLYNRNYIELTTNDWLKEAVVQNESIVCIVFDIDHFKWINDTYGHLFGDEVIKKVSTAASKAIGENAMIGRFGGDEFVVIIKGASLKRGISVAERIQAMIRDLEISNEGAFLTINLSMGIADNSDSM